MDEINDDEAMEVVLAEADDNGKKISKIKLFFKKVFGSRKAVIIIAVSFVLIIGLLVAKALFFSKENPEDGNLPNTMAAQENIKTMMVPPNEAVFEDIVDLEPFERIALKTGSTKGLININLSLELTDQRDREQVYKMEEQIRRIIRDQVKEETWLTLRSPEGKITLKYNLLEQVNSIFPRVTVRNIYFTNFIMQ